MSTLFEIRSNALESNFLKALLGMNLRKFGFFLNPNVIDLWAVNEFSGFLRIIMLSVGKFIPNIIRSLMQKVLINPQFDKNRLFEREFIFEKDSINGFITQSGKKIRSLKIIFPAQYQRIIKYLLLPIRIFLLNT